MHIYIALEIDKKQKKIINEKFLGHKVFFNSNLKFKKKPEINFLKSEIVFGNVPADWIKQSKKIKWIQLESTGFGEYLDLLKAQFSKKILFTNLKGFFKDPVAHSMIAGILCFYRGIETFVKLKEQKKWVGDPIRNKLETLNGKKIIFYGYGLINQELKNYLKPYKCSFDYINSKTNTKKIDLLLKQADIVACCAPETRHTINFFNSKKLNLLKKNTLLINAGRGSLIDENALVKLLKNKKIKGAVLDVSKIEPLKKESALWSCPNLILTQHTGGGSSDEISKKITFFEKNFKRFINNKSLYGKLNSLKGY